MKKSELKKIIREILEEGSPINKIKFHGVKTGTKVRVSSDRRAGVSGLSALEGKVLAGEYVVRLIKGNVGYHVNLSNKYTILDTIFANALGNGIVQIVK